MAARILTAAIGIPIFITALIYGGAAWGLLMLVLCLIGTFESARLLTTSDTAPFVWVAEAMACSLLVHAYIVSGDDLAEWTVPMSGIAIAVGLLLTLHALWPRARQQGLPALGATLSAAVYPGVFVAHLLVLRDVGLYPLLLAVLVTWATDTAAFFVGTVAGRHPLWPEISPKKTIEGAAGGLVAGSLVAMLLSAYFGLPWWPWMGIGLVVSASAQLGDLVESGLKRRAGAKDSGALLPGHGGVLDRLDSLFVSGTVVYYLYSFMG